MLSVVITTYHDVASCYLTAFSLFNQLARVGLTHEVIIVADGGTETKWERYGFRCLRVNAGSPQGSRDLGIRMARFNDVLLLESHVVLDDVSKLLIEHQRLKAALTFPIRRAEGTELFDVYAHETDWEGNLWYKRVIYEPVSVVSHPVAQFGHSCFVLDRSWYLGSGGYGKILKGWGGEEPLLCLKAWMTGRECWQVPGVSHYHYLTPGAHAEKPYLAENLEKVGYVIAGRRGKFKMTAEVESERQQICRGSLGGSLDKLRAHLREVGAVYA